MKRIAITLSTALLALTNSGYAQSLNTLELDYKKSQKVIQRLNPQADSTESLKGKIENLLAQNAKIDSKAMAQGGFDSGGGTLVRTTPTTGLLDLFLYNREAYLSQQQGSPLAETRSYKRFGFDRLQSNNSAIVAKTLRQVEKWYASSPVMAEVIATAVNELPIYYTSYELGFNDQSAFIPEGSNIPQKSLKLGAYYLANIGAFVQKQSFDKLSDKNQMALIIHEGLRHQQMTWESGMSNETLQKVTAEVLREPTAGATLDKLAYMKGKVLEGVLEEQNTIVINYEVAHQLCKVFVKYCYLKTTPLMPNSGDRDSKLKALSLRKDAYLQVLQELNELTAAGQKTKEQEALTMPLLDGFRTLQVASIKVLFGGKETRQGLFLVRTKFGTSLMDASFRSYNEGASYFGDDASALKKVRNFMLSNGYFK